MGMTPMLGTRRAVGAADIEGADAMEHIIRRWLEDGRSGCEGQNPRQVGTAMLKRAEIGRSNGTVDAERKGQRRRCASLWRGTEGKHSGFKGRNWMYEVVLEAFNERGLKLLLTGWIFASPTSSQG